MPFGHQGAASEIRATEQQETSRAVRAVPRIRPSSDRCLSLSAISCTTLPLPKTDSLGSGLSTQSHRSWLRFPRLRHFFASRNSRLLPQPGTLEVSQPGLVEHPELNAENDAALNADGDVAGPTLQSAQGGHLQGKAEHPRSGDCCKYLCT